MTDHTYDIIALFDRLSDNGLENLTLERQLKHALMPVIADLSEDERAKMATSIAYRVHDLWVMDERCPMSAKPALEKVLDYTHLRFGVADWQNRYDALQTELDEMEASGLDLIDDLVPGTDTYDEL